MESVALFGIGSTNFRYVAATPDGEFRTDVAVEPARPRTLETQLAGAIESLGERASIDAVSIAVPGLVDADTGIVRDLDTPDGDLVDRLDLRSSLERRYEVPVYLANDCNASALGEWHFGARGGADCLVHLTIGTGIGGGVVDRGRLLRGESGGAGEFGLLPVAIDTGLGSTGVTGAWEAVCSGRGIPRFVAHRYRSEAAETALAPAIESGDLAAPDVFEAADDGDAFARDCLARVDRYNAAGVGAICNAYEPGRITVGGGVALGNTERILSGIEAHLGEFCFVEPPAIDRTELDDDIGLYGALGSFLERSRGATPVEPGRRRSVPESVD